MATWDATYETLPPGTLESGGLGDDRIRSWKAEVGSRFDQEHHWDNTGSTGQCRHRQGSTRTYYQAATPTLRPDAATALGNLDAGRLFVDSDTYEAYVWNGSAFQIIGGRRLTDQGGSSFLRIKIIPIGTWNIFALTVINVAHGLTLDTIRRVDAFIQDDALTVLTDVQSKVGTASVQGSNINVIVSSYFATSDYSNTSINRGYIVIWYAGA